MAHSAAEPISAGDDDTPGAADRPWRTKFLAQLATTSNVQRAAEVAGVSPDQACQLRRSDPEFARDWLAALAEGYLHLEMEVVRRLREGDFKTADAEKYDFANAVRLIGARRSTGSAQGQPPVRDVSPADVRASIDRKIEDIRRRMARQDAAQGRTE